MALSGITEQYLLEKLIRWGEKEQSVRALILSGSRAQEKVVDDFSNYDIACFVHDSSKYEASDLWLSKITSMKI